MMFCKVKIEYRLIHCMHVVQHLNKQSIATKGQHVFCL